MIVTCARHGFQRSNRSSTLGLGRAQSQRIPNQHQSFQSQHCQSATWSLLPVGLFQISPLQASTTVYKRRYTEFVYSLLLSTKLTHVEVTTDCFGKPLALTEGQDEEGSRVSRRLSMAVQRQGQWTVVTERSGAGQQVEESLRIEAQIGLSYFWEV